MKMGWSTNLLVKFLLCLQGICSTSPQEIDDCSVNPNSSWCKFNANEEKTFKDMTSEQMNSIAPKYTNSTAISSKHTYHMHRRATRDSCPYYNMWRFTCVDAWKYSNYLVGRNWYLFEGKYGYFDAKCCNKFQAMCHASYGYFSCPRLIDIYKEEFDKDISKQCCFIIKSKSSGIWVLTGSKYDTADFTVCGSSGYNPSTDSSTSCAYSPYSESLPQKIDTSIQKCLKDFNDDYTCCSELSGSICKNYGAGRGENNIGHGNSCSDDCKQIASCDIDHQNPWCVDVPLEGANLATIQHAKYKPKALVPQNRRRRRAGIWSACPPWEHWRYTCFKCVHYMKYSNRNSYYTVWGKDYYFKRKCCSEFQSKCINEDDSNKNTRYRSCP